MRILQLESLSVLIFIGILQEMQNCNGNAAKKNAVIDNHQSWIFFSHFIITSEYDKPFKLDLFKTSHEAGIMKQFIFVFRNVQSNETIWTVIQL